MLSKRLCVAAAAVLFVSAPALAQEYGPYGYGGGGFGFDWDGFYSGVYGGGQPMSDPAAWNAGIFTGVNVTLDSILLGAEAQVGIDADDNFALDALILARGGLTLGDMAIYALGGGGIIEGGAG